MDLILFYLHMSHKNECFMARQPILKVSICKIYKHDKACIINHYVFIPFTFDRFCFLAPKVAVEINRAQRFMHTLL